MEDSSQITQDTTCTAQYNIKTYTISISPNGASGSTKTYTVSHGNTWTVPSCPFSKEDYTFKGYSGGYLVGQTITVTEDISFYCIWQPDFLLVLSRYASANATSPTYSRTPLYPGEHCYINGYTLKTSTGNVNYAIYYQNVAYHSATVKNETGTKAQYTVQYIGLKEDGTYSNGKLPVNKGVFTF